MEKKNSTFSLLLLGLVLALGYILRFDLFIFMGYGYALINKPAGQQLIGEYYSEKARRAKHQAFLHYRVALGNMIKRYPTVPKKEQAAIAKLIASNYECAKGTAVNLKEAQRWHDKAKK